MTSMQAFRKYDIRGIIGTELMFHDIYAITQAIAYYFKEKDPTIISIIVGMDGRTHSPKIKDEVCRALRDSGLNVLFIGLCPTPAVHYACHYHHIPAALMITASHNPKNYNGLKIIFNEETVWDHELQQIKSFYEEKKSIAITTKGWLRTEEIVPYYARMLTQRFSHLRGCPYTMVIDCSNGATGPVMHMVAQWLSLKNAVVVNGTVNGNFPRHEPDPTTKEGMQDVATVMKLAPCLIGVGFDGDGDRLSVMTTQGFQVPSDQLLAIFAYSLGKIFKQGSVAFDVKCSDGLREVIEKSALKPIVTPTGFAYIRQAMKEHNAFVGAELSGHFCFSDYGIDDGIYTFLRTLEMIFIEGKTIDKLLEIFPKKITTPEIRITCAQPIEAVEQAKNKLTAIPQSEILALDGIRLHTSYGWGIVRASHTQPMISMRFEANNEEQLQQLKQHFFDALATSIDPVLLKQELNLS